MTRGERRAIFLGWSWGTALPSRMSGIGLRAHIVAQGLARWKESEARRDDLRRQVMVSYLGGIDRAREFPLGVWTSKGLTPP